MGAKPILTTTMKTTLEIDEVKLKNLMRLKKIKTRREAVDFALSEATRKAEMDAFFGTVMDHSEYVDVVAEDYDLETLRNKEIP